VRKNEQKAGFYLNWKKKVGKNPEKGGGMANPIRIIREVY